MWKILNKRYLWKYWSSVFETWHHKGTSQKKQNDTLSAVSIATLLAPVSVCQKAKKSPFAASTVGQRVLLGTEIVPILSLVPSLDWVGYIVLVLKQNRKLQFLLTQHQRQNCCHGNSTRGVILFIFWCTVVVPFIFKKTRLECSRKLEKVMTLMAFFFMTKRGCKADLFENS